MMVVDVQVALRLKCDVDQGMARELFQHVIKKTYARLHVISPGAVETDGCRDPVSVVLRSIEAWRMALGSS